MDLPQGGHHWRNHNSLMPFADFVQYKPGCPICCSRWRDWSISCWHECSLEFLLQQKSPHQLAKTSSCCPPGSMCQCIQNQRSPREGPWPFIPHPVRASCSNVAGTHHCQTTAPNQEDITCEPCLPLWKMSWSCGHVHSAKGSRCHSRISRRCCDLQYSCPIWCQVAAPRKWHGIRESLMSWKNRRIGWMCFWALRKGRKSLRWWKETLSDSSRIPSHSILGYNCWLQFTLSHASVKCLNTWINNSEPELALIIGHSLFLSVQADIWTYKM